MVCFFYIEGESDARANRNEVRLLCQQFVQRHTWRNKVWCVDHDLEGGVDVGVNIEKRDNGFEVEVVRLLSFIRQLIQKLGIAFVLGTDGEDRDWMDAAREKTNEDIARFHCVE